MRAPILRASFDPSELVVDNFAGGSGGLELVRGAVLCYLCADFDQTEHDAAKRQAWSDVDAP